MITISTPTADTEGTVILTKHSQSDLKSNTSRVSRVATLDGGVVINHLGISDGDRTLKIKANVTEVIGDALWYIYQNYSYILIGIKEGLFYGTIQAFKIIKGQAQFTVLINNKETE